MCRLVHHSVSDVENVCKASLCQYFKPRDGILILNGSLSASIPTQAIAHANKEAARVLHETTKEQNVVLSQSKYMPHSLIYVISLNAAVLFKLCSHSARVLDGFIFFTQY